MEGILGGLAGAGFATAVLKDRRWRALGAVLAQAMRVEEPRLAGRRIRLWRHGGRGHAGRSVASLVLTALTISLGLSLRARAACPVVPGARHAVTALVDGERLRLDDGREVVLAGVLLPRAPAELSGTGAHPAGLTAGSGAAAELGGLPETGTTRGKPAPATWPLADAATAALTQLTDGRTIDLGMIGRQRDRYGRILAQVTLTAEPSHVTESGLRLAARGAATTSTGAGQPDNPVWLQAWLVRNGLARVLPAPGLKPCTEALLALERQARAARLGLWGNVAYAPKRSDQPKELLRLQHSFVLVEGTVLEVAERRRTTYLNFGSTWYEDFTVEVDTGAGAVVPAGIAALSALNGRRVRVRGWLVYRGGPMIPVNLAEQIELLDATP